MLAARYGLEAVAKLLLTAPGINVNAADTGGRTALTWAVFAGKEAIVLDLCAVPEIIVDVADVKRRLEHPPKGWPYGTRILKDKQDKCVRILEEFAGSNGGGAQDGAVSEKPGGG
ncbi:hypothetical protein DFP72DRAFT_872885 [Ephemerocybe angulata]|uniref:Uncharacterized protein n=1 Tax=Ephemerocybe angulata TaxID=980116 RepID=A0A8H6IFW7_9AGAR|nr:hypothetical protein DFP72DRAFT_872885 [Tulosesus angulatus]